MQKNLDTKSSKMAEGSGLETLFLGTHVSLKKRNRRDFVLFVGSQFPDGI